MHPRSWPLLPSEVNFFPTLTNQVAISRLEEEARVAKEAKEETDKASGARIATMEEENALLKVQAERVEVLVARCARLEVSTLGGSGAPLPPLLQCSGSC